MACDVSIMTVFDWIRLDKEPEKMTQKEFNLYKRRITELENPDRIRYYISMMCRKKFPFLQIIEAAAKGYSFKKESDFQSLDKWVYSNLISKGIVIDPSKKKTSPKAKKK